MTYPLDPFEAAAEKIARNIWADGNAKATLRFKGDGSELSTYQGVAALRAEAVKLVEAMIGEDEPVKPWLSKADFDKARAAASLIELELLEQALNAGRDMQEYKLARMKILLDRYDRLTNPKGGKT
jgi:hypothetical protein